MLIFKQLQWNRRNTVGSPKKIWLKRKDFDQKKTC